jgi:hypothetical protein
MTIKKKKSIVKETKKASGNVYIVQTNIKRVVPDMYYTAKFTEIKEVKGKFGPCLKLRFAMLNGETEDGESAKDVEIDAFLPANLNPKHEAYKVVCTIVGKDLAVDDVIDLNSYIGKKYKVFIEDNNRQREDGEYYQKITKVTPYIVKK